MKTGRNEKCCCGSGKKYKYCCLNRKEAYIPVNSAHKFIGKKPIEKNLHIVPSIVAKGYRLRAIWNRIYKRPLKETFHEFIMSMLLGIYGEEWRKQQMELDEKDRHIIMKWVFSDFELSKKALMVGEKEIDEYGIETWGCIASGESQALIQLAYDIYCLQIINKLPSFMIKKLKDKVDFQSVRYEIAVAAIMARAGFDIEFLDDKIKSEKHCEFIAKHKNSGIEIGVEAKSRRRKGVLNESGEYNYNMDIRGDMWFLFKKARSQKADGLPFLIFIDMNIRPTPDIPLDSKPWNKDIVKMVSDYGEATEERPDPYNALILTNYSFYYTGQEEMPSGEYFFVISKVPETKLVDSTILDEVFESVHCYSRIPEEV